MNVASLELCKELYELSGWDDTLLYQVAVNRGLDSEYIRVAELDDDEDLEDVGAEAPAYDLGCLLRKIPLTSPSGQYLQMDALDGQDDDKWYEFGYAEYGEIRGASGSDKTPEDAVAKLAIELFNQGILKKEKE